MNLINNYIDALALYKLTTSSRKENHFQAHEIITTQSAKGQPCILAWLSGDWGEPVSLFSFGCFLLQSISVYVNCRAVFPPLFLRKHLLPGQSVNGLSA